MKKKKLLILAAAAVLLLVWYLWFTRPVTIEQKYPMLTQARCSEIYGYYRVDPKRDDIRFTIEKDSEDFQKAWDLVFNQTYRRRLRDLLPYGTRSHRYVPGDYWWRITFVFNNVVLPDGTTTEWTLMNLQNWYGELDIDYIPRNGTHFYRTTDQEAWLAEVLEIISRNQDS